MLVDGLCGVLISAVAVIIFLLIIHYVYLLSNYNYWKKRSVFSPNSSSLVGNLPGQVTGKRHFVYDLDDLYKEYKNKHPFIGIFHFRQPRLLVFDPEIIKSVMIKYFRYFQGTEFTGKIDKSSDKLFGSHPFFLVGDEWRSKRAEISPAFTNTRVSPSIFRSRAI